MSIFEAAGVPANQTEGTNEAPGETAVFVEYYTDPLCSWSWAFEAQWRYLRYLCAGRLKWRYRMGGLLADWHSYHDPFNDISKPSQVAPQWFQVCAISGMPLDEQIWNQDPPDSSYPACLAVKAAERQGQEVTEEYLRRLREAVMIERRNIARQDILLAVAQEMVRSSRVGKSFDLDRFHEDLASVEALEAFRQDLRDAAYYGIGRFPTLILYRSDGRGIILVGYRPFNALGAALEYFVPGVLRKPEGSPEEIAVAYVKYWQRVIARELIEVYGGDSDQASLLLDSLVARGTLVLANAQSSQAPIYIAA